MTDDRRLEIERRFDGEPGSFDPLGDPADDPEALRHLERLAKLRRLALIHDPALNLPRKPFNLPGRGRNQTARWLAIAATAAAVVLAYGWSKFPRGGEKLRVEVVVIPEKSPGRPIEAVAGRPPLEIALYGWANTPSRAPKQAARLVLGPASPSKKRSSADEILALELANTSPQPRGSVQRFAVSKGPRSVPLPRPGVKTRVTRPDV